MIEPTKQNVLVMQNRKHKGFKDRPTFMSSIQETISLPLCDETLPDRISRYVQLPVADRSSLYSLFP